MTYQMLIGTVMIAIGLVLAVGTALFGGRPHESLWGVLVAESGSMWVVSGLVAPGTPRIGVSIFFGIAIIWTALSIRSQSRAFAAKQRPSS
jgi:hypothetical protein